GFGTVFSATREPSGERVAIKVARLDVPVASQRLAYEADALHAIGPPHVPAVLASGTLADGAPYLVLEFLPMPTLASRLAELGRPIALDEFATYARSILIALEAAHERGFVHRDIKPDNIFIADAPPIAKLVDFGIVKALPSTSLLTANTTRGTVLGTAE